jgi:lysine-specific demethylase/histidyl-hydroxylase NO66
VTTRETTAATLTPDDGARAPERTGVEGPGALELTLGPISLEAFRDEHWERRPLRLARAESGRFDGILSTADVERLVCTTGIRSPAFRLVRDGGQIALSQYTENVPWRPGSFSERAIVSRVAEEFERGATIVVQGLNLHWHRAALYCRELELGLGCPVQANAYYTPASAQGFAVHHDTHDVFVLQVSGRKRWRVYEPVVELPLKKQRWSPRLGQVGAPVEDFVLEPGDTLYLPRGWPHEAATSDAESLHITVGMHPYTRLDALRAALDSCADDVEFRRSVAGDGRLPGDLLGRLAERLEPAQVARRMRRKFVSSCRPILDGQLTQVRALEGLTAGHRLARRPTVIADLELDEAGAVLLFDGTELLFPPKAAAALEAVYSAAEPFTAAELPGPLDEDGRLVLVRRLVREGFLQVEEPL